MSYRQLDPIRIEETIQTLYKRIEERFPNRGLGKLCQELLSIAQEDRRRLSWQRKPNLLIRFGVGAAILLALAVIGYVFATVATWKVEAEAFNALQGIEAAISVVALSGAASWFLLNLESRIRRRAVLMDLHELRSIAHVVDMLQLTKDPTTLANNTGTASSQRHGMSEFQLARYLDYCSELLSLTGKLAALYMQDMRDPIVIDAVNDIEDLTGNMSRKIWQKIMILQQPPKAWSP